MIWTAIAIGFAGSLHCLGMCSPLAIAITNMSPAAALTRLLYNAGRILTYGVMGAGVATAGMAFPLARYQNLVSIVLGVSLLAIALAGVPAVKIPLLSRVLANFSLFLKGMFSRFLQRKGYGPTFLLGALNGMLPCGLSFLALAYCLTLAGPADGLMFMIGFGIGTLPVMIGFTGIFFWLLNRFHLNVRTIITAMLLLSGVMLVARVFIVHLPHADAPHRGVVDIVLCR